MALWPKDPLNPLFQRKASFRRHPGEQRDHGIERLDIDGQRLRRCHGVDGCRVPIRKPVAGSRSDWSPNTKEISSPGIPPSTDIIGSEDHFGDMDFKLCGPRDGITGFQLDLKLPGVSLKIITEAVRLAREARMDVLDVMAKAIAGLARN